MSTFVFIYICIYIVHMLYDVESRYIYIYIYIIDYSVLLYMLEYILHVHVKMNSLVTTNRRCSFVLEWDAHVFSDRQAAAG